MKITKEQYDILSKINTNSFNKAGSTCINVNDLTKKDKIYILPNCKIKKLDLRKWFKFKGFKQVHKPELASVIVTPSSLIGSDFDTKIRISKGVIIPAGTYYYGDTKTVYTTFTKETRLYGWKLENFINHIHCHKGAWVSSSAKRFLSIIQRYKQVYSADTTLQSLTPNIINTLASDVKLINVDDIQQVLYDWEVETNVRESVEYDWDNLKSMILGDSFELVFVMIKKMNFETILSELLSCYYCNDVDIEFKKKLFKEIFVRNPKLMEVLPGPYSYSITNSWRKDEKIDDLVINCLSKGIVLDRSKFEWVLN